MNCKCVALSVALFLGVVGCTSTQTEPETIMDRELTATGIDDVGIVDEGANYQWFTYKSVLPFAGEAKESTAIHPTQKQDVFASPPSKSKKVSQSRSLKRR